MRRRGAEDAFRSYRQDIGRAILLGLEFLGGRGHHPYRGGVTDVHERRRLGLIVLIRTFLSFTLGPTGWQDASRPTTGARWCWGCGEPGSEGVRTQL
jgi:hypothetical protein